MVQIGLLLLIYLFFHSNMNFLNCCVQSENPIADISKVIFHGFNPWEDGRLEVKDIAIWKIKRTVNRLKTQRNKSSRVAR